MPSSVPIHSRPIGISLCSTIATSTSGAVAPCRPRRMWYGYNSSCCKPPQQRHGDDRHLILKPIDHLLLQLSWQSVKPTRRRKGLSPLAVRFSTRCLVSTPAATNSTPALFISRQQPFAALIDERDIAQIYYCSQGSRGAGALPTNAQLAQPRGRPADRITSIDASHFRSNNRSVAYELCSDRMHFARQDRLTRPNPHVIEVFGFSGNHGR